MSADLVSQAFAACDPPRLDAAGWELLLAQARGTRLLSRLAHHVDDRAAWRAALPARVAPHLSSALRVGSALQANVRCELGHLARALGPLQTPVVLLKGAAYVAAGLPAARGRLFSDIDILVPRERLHDVELALFAGGWIAEKLKPYDDRYYRRWMHELPPLRHVQRESHLDVHHTIAPPTSRFVVPGDMLMAASVALPPGQPWADVLRVLAPEDMVLHSALHLLQEGEFHAGLRDLLDMRDLLLDFGRDAGFWPRLARRAAELRLEAVLAQVLAQLQRLFALHLPHGFVTAHPQLVVAGWRAALLHCLLTRALRPAAPAAEPAATRAARWLLYVRSHALRMPWYQIAPHLGRKAWARFVDRWTPPPLALASDVTSRQET